MTELLVLGSGLAGLIVALEQVRRGQRVALLADGRAPGGHFAGIEADGLAFDFGMVMFEQHMPAEPCDVLAAYRPAIRNDWTRFGHLASDWLNAQLPLRRVPTPECLVGGRCWPDYLIANRLDALAAAAVGVAGPPPALSPDDPRHAAHKLQAGPYDRIDYAAAAALNHGVALHQACIEPFVRKLTGGDSAQFLARQHRAAWVPLFYPETLAAAMAGAPTGLPEYPFWTSDTGCVGHWVAAMNAELAASPQARVVSSPLTALEASSTGWQARTADGQLWRAPRAVLALPAQRCCTLLGLAAPALTPSVSVSVSLCSVPSEQLGRPVGCLMVVDEEFATYRISCPDVLAGLTTARVRLAVETNPEVLARLHPGAEPAAVLRAEVGRLLALPERADLRIHRQLTARDSLPLPTLQNLDAMARTHADVSARAPGAWLTGSLLGHGVASINDQIVQALHICRENRA